MSVEQIYKNWSVLEIEAAGFEVLSGLLHAFLPAVFSPQAKRHQKLLDLIPDQYLEQNRTLENCEYKKS